MLRLSALCLAFVLLAALSPIIPVAKSGTADTAVRGSDPRPGEQQAGLRRGGGIQAGPAVSGSERDAQATVAEPPATVTDEYGPDHAGPGKTEPTGIEPLNTVQEQTEPAEAEPLAPIETQNSIRVNANVSLPQDI